MLMNATAALLADISDEANRLKNEILSSLNYIPAPDSEVRYVAPDGNDNADGCTPQSAWKSLDALNVRELKPGTVVLFERGGIWRGQLLAQNGVTYSAYGDGEKPKIVGSPFDGAKVRWDEVAPGVWKCRRKIPYDCGLIVCNGGCFHAAKITLDYTGAVPCDIASRIPFTGYTDLSEDLTFWHDLSGPNIEKEGAGWIYLCSKEGNPAERFDSIEFLPRRNIIQITGEDITVDNLSVMYGGAHGVGSVDTRNLKVTNCVFGWIGGSVQFYNKGGKRPVRYGNGVEIYGSVDGYIIDHCWVYQIYDAGITHQVSNGCGPTYMRHVSYTNNLIDYCSYSIEYFLGTPDPDKITEDTPHEMEDILFKGNILRFSGYGWGQQRPDKTNPAHIKGWDHLNRLKGDFIIEDNTIAFGRCMMLHIGVDEEKWMPVFTGNTFLQYSGSNFGRLGQNPTAMTEYNAETALDERFAGNEFYILDND